MKITNDERRWLRETLKRYDRLKGLIADGFGAEICRLCRGKKTLREFASEHGVSHTYVWRVERDIDPIDIPFLKSILRVR